MVHRSLPRVPNPAVGPAARRTAAGPISRARTSSSAARFAKSAATSLGLAGSGSRATTRQSTCCQWTRRRPRHGAVTSRRPTPFDPAKPEEARAGATLAGTASRPPFGARVLSNLWSSGSQISARELAKLLDALHPPSVILRKLGGWPLSMITSETPISARQFVCCIGMCMVRSGCDVWRLPRHTRAVDRGGACPTTTDMKGGANAEWAGTWQAQRDVVPAGTTRRRARHDTTRHRGGAAVVRGRVRDPGPRRARVRVSVICSVSHAMRCFNIK